MFIEAEKQSSLNPKVPDFRGMKANNSFTTSDYNKAMETLESYEKVLELLISKQDLKTSVCIEVIYKEAMVYIHTVFCRLVESSNYYYKEMLSDINEKGEGGHKANASRFGNVIRQINDIKGILTAIQNTYSEYKKEKDIELSGEIVADDKIKVLSSIPC